MNAEILETIKAGKLHLVCRF